MQKPQSILLKVILSIRAPSPRESTSTTFPGSKSKPCGHFLMHFKLFTVIFSIINNRNVTFISFNTNPKPKILSRGKAKQSWQSCIMGRQPGPTHTAQIQFPARITAAESLLAHNEILCL